MRVAKHVDPFPVLATTVISPYDRPLIGGSTLWLPMKDDGSNRDNAVTDRHIGHVLEFPSDGVESGKEAVVGLADVAAALVEDAVRSNEEYFGGLGEER
jgi:hypothetical protein